MKQTALDILFHQIKLKADSILTNTAENRKVKGAYVDCLTLIRKAIEIEKEMIIETSKNSYIAGYLDNQAKVDDSSNFPEDYYNETFNTK
jgi:translation elongation factor EF-Ts